MGRKKHSFYLPHAEKYPGCEDDLAHWNKQNKQWEKDDGDWRTKDWKDWRKKDETSWDTGEKVSDKKVSACGWTSDIKEKILISPELYCKIRYLCKKIDSEWQMLLSGEVRQDCVFLNGYYIPKQKVTGATVENNDCVDKLLIEEHKILATIHSHSGMGLFFSYKDELNNSQTIAYHIVTNNDGGFKAVKKVNLPCGKFAHVDVDVEVAIMEQEVEGIERIEKEHAYDHIGCV